MLKNMKIGKKLMLGFAVLLVIMALVATFGTYFIIRIDDETSYETSYPGERYNMLNYQSIDLMDLRRLVTFMAYNAGNDASLSAAAEDILRVRQNLRTYLNMYQESLQDDPRLTDDREAHFLGIARELDSFIMRYVNEVIDPMYEAAMASDHDEMDRIIALGIEIYSEISTRFDYLMNAADETIDNIAEDISSLMTLAMTIMVVLTLGGIAVGVFVAIIFARMITRPIKDVSQVVESVSNGILAINFKSDLSADETGEMTKNVYNMVNVIKSMVEDLITLEREFNVVGDIDYRIDAGKYQNTFREMMEGVNKVPDSIIHDVLGLLDALKEINNGNFNITCKDLPGKKMVLPNSLRATIDNLKNISTEVNAMINAAAVRGELNFQIDEAKYAGGWREIMTGLNNIAKAVDAPLSEIRDVMNKLSVGEFGTKVTGNYAGDFLAIGNSVNATIDALSGYISEMAKTLESISNGDLTQAIRRDYVGSFANMKNSINNISTSLNKTMTEIAAASTQVLSGAKQISASAQSLAVGAQEQASAIEELNASVDMINQQTQDNAENAAQANSLSGSSTDNAQKGNESMKHMLSAMVQIKESSNNISKIIKTIQDIAFQTNLLSLNAAVEAARAGEHGRGFSVVAEEVRSLASRSQEATVETTGLIENSIERVESGSSIAEETAKSLDVIVENASAVSEIINRISSASADQAEATSQVVIGLSQISNVVQSNSAVSEETAAASEELNSQAEVLQQLVSYFKL